MFLLVPSPLLGPATWRPVEAWLRERGHEVKTVDFGPKPRTPDRVLEAVVTAADQRPVVLVPHSNAGLYAPHLTTLLEVQATVFVDAALPERAAEGGTTSLTTPAMLDFLRGLADPDGILPAWTEWWGDLADLFPDQATREAVELDQQRLPLSYFTSRIPVPAEWSGRPAAYLAFGATYSEEIRLATEAGWPTRTMAGRHLHALHDPAAVGAAILDHYAVASRDPEGNEFDIS